MESWLEPLIQQPAFIECLFQRLQSATQKQNIYKHNLHEKFWTSKYWQESWKYLHKEHGKYKWEIYSTIEEQPL